MYRTESVSVRGEHYLVTLRIFPARSFSHAGPDSPDYMRPGRQERAEITRIRDGNGVELDLPAVKRQEIIDAVVDGLSRRPETRPASRLLAVSFQRRTQQYQLPIGHLSRAFERTGGEPA